jgi:hypothetical protein
MVQTGDVFVGVDMGKDAHYAQVIGPDGDAMFDRPVPNDDRHPSRRGPVGTGHLRPVV